MLYPDGVITHVNTMGAKLLGAEPEQLVGQKLSNFVESELKVLEVFKTGQAIIDKEMFIPSLATIFSKLRMILLYRV